MPGARGVRRQASTLPRGAALLWLLAAGAGAEGTPAGLDSATTSYVEIGEASWYGHEFAGRSTASGETFDVSASTVAHPSLPLGSVVEIRNLENGRRTVARINDRGPFAKDRIIDCSLAVARTLGFVGQGLTQVQVTLLDSLVSVPAILARRIHHAPGHHESHQPAVAETRRPEDELARLRNLPDVDLPDPRDPAGDPTLRRASVLPFPALVQGSRWLYQVLLGPCVVEIRERSARGSLDSTGLRGFVRLFTR